ncbi:hypothetical protein C6I20_10565 [Aeromicrobium sp. A1-2]|uniref:hypothetical protein n=1 Tax=Aeromicrobium sp. A1-2 TaxID=2107713 RepID=UPI000E5094A6|nr:hypothetical protein [Aeromicrobium sp. A1-2]AXT85591.1 hypothetical protein C6I20_10565 [Aeromicrobium sp. A1-2]
MAASVVLVETGTSIVLAGFSLVDVVRERSGAGVGGVVILVAYGLFQAWAAWRVTEGDRWARSPLVVTQIIQLLIAFNLADVPDWITGLLAGAAVLALACLLAPPVTRALSAEPPV